MADQKLTALTGVASPLQRTDLFYTVRGANSLKGDLGQLADSIVQILPEWTLDANNPNPPTAPTGAAGKMYRTSGAPGAYTYGSQTIYPDQIVTFRADGTTVDVLGGGTGGGGGMTRTVLTSAPASPIADNGIYFLDFSGGMFNVTLPAAPSQDTNIVIQVVGGDIEAEPLLTKPRLLRNGNNVEGLAEDIVLNVNYVMATIRRGSASYGYFVK